jgi:hypothetical protein
MREADDTMSRISRPITVLPAWFIIQIWWLIRQPVAVQPGHLLRPGKSAGVSWQCCVDWE